MVGLSGTNFLRKRVGMSDSGSAGAWIIRTGDVGAGGETNISFKSSFGLAVAGSGFGISSVCEDDAASSFSARDSDNGDVSGGVVDDDFSSESVEGCGSGNAASGSKGCGTGVSVISGSVGGKPESGVASLETGTCKRFRKPSAFGFSGCIGIGTGLITAVGSTSDAPGSAVFVGSSIEAGGLLGITDASGSGVVSALGSRTSGTTVGSGDGTSRSSGSLSDGLGTAAGRRKRLKKPPDFGVSGSIGTGTGLMTGVGTASGSGVDSSTTAGGSIGVTDASGSGVCSDSSGTVGSADGLGAADGRRKRLKKPPDFGFSVVSVGVDSVSGVGFSSGVAGSEVGVSSTEGVTDGIGVGVSVGDGLGVGATSGTGVGLNL